MAIGANDSSKQIVSSLWTGVANMQVIAINPTMEQLKAMGRNPQKEPQYLSDSDKGHKKFRIDFYLNNPLAKINAKLSIFTEATPRVSKDGANMFINKFGDSAYPKKGTVEINYDWFRKDGIRQCFIGEDVLINFIKNWANVDTTKDACSLDTISAIVNGDLTELNNLFNSIKTNQVQVLLGVKDGKYQDVYTKHFDRPYRKGFDVWKKALEGQYGEFKDADYQGDLHLKPFEGSAEVKQDTPSSFSMNSGAGAPTGGATKVGNYNF